MRKNIQLVSLVITIVLFFVINGIMQMIDFSPDQQSNPAAVIVIATIVAIIVALLAYTSLRMKKKRQRMI